MSSCIISTSLIEATLLITSVYILADIAFREVPKIIIKFRVSFAINILITQIYYSSLELQFNGAEQWIAWLLFLRAGTGWIVVLFLLENFVRVLFVMADIGARSSMELASPLLRCWSIYRVIVMVYSVAVGAAFSVLGTNEVYMANVVGNMVSINFIVFPVCIVVARLSFLIRRHQQKLRQQEIKLADDENKFVEDMEAQEAKTAKKKGHKRVASTNPGKGFASMQRAKDRSRIKKTERQLALFCVVVLICCLAWDYSNLQDLIEYGADRKAQWQPPTCAITYGHIMHIVTSVFGVVITRAPNATKRRWVQANPWVTTIARTLMFSRANSGGQRSPHVSADRPSGGDSKNSKRSRGHFRAHSGGMASISNSQAHAGGESADSPKVGSYTADSPQMSPSSQVNSPFVSPSVSRRGSNAGGHTMLTNASSSPDSGDQTTHTTNGTTDDDFVADEAAFSMTPPQEASPVEAQMV